MATYVFNRAKGRVTELAERVEAGDPTNARFYVIPLSATPAQATAQDVDDFAALISAGATELTTGGWNRKTLTSTEIAVAYNDTNDRSEVDSTDLTWTAVSSGNSVALTVCYASVASPTNAQLLVLTHHDFAITADGSDVVAQITDLFRAT